MGEGGGGASPLPPPHRAREARPVTGILGAAITLIKSESTRARNYSWSRKVKNRPKSADHIAGYVARFDVQKPRGASGMLFRHVSGHQSSSMTL